MATGIDLIDTAGTNNINNQGILLVVGGAGGGGFGRNLRIAKSGDGAMGTGIDLTNSIAKTTIVNGSVNNNLNAQIRGIGGRAGGFGVHAVTGTVSGNGADGIGINLSLAVGAQATSLVNYGLIEGLGGTGGLGESVASAYKDIYGLGADGFAIKADTASPVSITNHFQLVANGGSFDEINTDATGGDAIGIKADAATTAGVITYTQTSTGTILVVGGWATNGITPGNATGILTGAAPDVITIEGWVKVLGGVDGFGVVQGTALGISTGDGNDIVSLKNATLTVTGIGTSVAIDLGAGDDTLSLDSSTITGGTIKGGAGTEDTLDVTGQFSGTLSEEGSILNPLKFTTTVTEFEQFTKSGTIAIQLNQDTSFTASGSTKFAVNVTGGTLLIDDTKTFTAAVGKFEVQSGATISGKGTYNVDAAEVGLVVNDGGVFAFGRAGDTVNVSAAGKVVRFKARLKSSGSPQR